MVITWKEPADSQFPLVEIEVCEAAQYASMWNTKESLCAQEKHFSFVLLSMDLHMVVNQYPKLSPRLYEQYDNITTFKVDFHRVFIKAWKDPIKIWHPLPYLVIEDDLITIIQHFSAEWMNPTIDDIEAARGTTQYAGPGGKNRGK